MKSERYVLSTRIAVAMIAIIGLFFLPITSYGETSSTLVFTKNLSLGKNDAEVKSLQIILNLDPDTVVASEGPGSYGNETTYFGKATQNAVIRFQNKYKNEVLTQGGLTRGTGYVGALTRNKLNLMFAPTLSASPSPILVPPAAVASKIPIIEKIVPDHGQYGSEFTIYGKNFSATNTIHTTYLPFYNIASQSATEIKFTFINPPFTQLQQLKDRGKKVDDLNLAFYIFVENEYGKSSEQIRYTTEIRRH